MRTVVVAAFIFLLACENPFAIEGAQRFTPDPDWGWRVLYDSVETCTGLEGNYDRIRWFEARYLEHDGEPAYGLWHEEHRIYLVRPDVFEGGARSSFRRSTVRHEMIHDVTLETGHKHKHPAFDRCGRK